MPFLSYHGDKGIDYAPDLTKIGDIRSKEDLLEAIVYPDSSIARYYEQLIIKPQKGKAPEYFVNTWQIRLSRFRAREPKSLFSTKTLLKRNILPSSLMPTIFDGFNTLEIADIIAYLKEAK